MNRGTRISDFFQCLLGWSQEVRLYPVLLRRWRCFLERSQVLQLNYRTSGEDGLNSNSFAAALWHSFLEMRLSAAELGFIAPTAYDKAKVVRFFLERPLISAQAEMAQELADIHHSPLCDLPEERRAELLPSLVEFHYIVWKLCHNYNGFCDHFEQSPEESICAMAALIGINPWSLAVVFHRCGYALIHSGSTADIYARWSGTANEGYSHWVGLLQQEQAEQILSPEQISQLNFWGDICFGRQGAVFPGADLLETCPILQYLQESQASQEQDCAHKLLTNRAAQIADAALIRYIWTVDRQGGDSLPANEIQAKAHYDQHQENYSTALVSSGNRSWPLFWRAIQEFNRRVGTPQAIKGQPFSSAADLFCILRPHFENETQESFAVAPINAKHNIIDVIVITKGLLNQTLVHSREIFAPVLLLRAVSVVLIHNHPSGDPQPSAADYEVTQQLCSVGQLLGIPVLDHIIIGSTDYYSFHENGEIHWGANGSAAQ